MKQSLVRDTGKVNPNSKGKDTMLFGRARQPRKTKKGGAGYPGGALPVMRHTPSRDVIVTVPVMTHWLCPNGPLVSVWSGT